MTTENEQNIFEVQKNLEIQMNIKVLKSLLSTNEKERIGDAFEFAKKKNRRCN